MKLLKHANVYTPAPLGKRDVLIEGERILRIAEEITGYDELPDVDVYDLSGKTLRAGLHRSACAYHRWQAESRVRLPVCLESSLSILF